MNGNLFMCYVTLSKFETFPAFTVKSNSILEDFPQNLISLEVFSQKTKIQAHALSFQKKFEKNLLYEKLVFKIMFQISNLFQNRRKILSHFWPFCATCYRSWAQS